MLTSDNCFEKDRCKKFENNECKDGFCVKLFKLNKLYDYSLLSDSQRIRTKLRPEADGTDKSEFNTLKSIEVDVVNFIDNGRNLYIHSSTCGNGKTAWAIKIMQAYLDRIWPTSDLKCRALFINVPRFLLTLKDNISEKSDYIEHIKRNVLNADLVVWDEVATKELTTYEHENLLNLINTRIDEGKSNIYTSNLMADDLKEKIGDRLYSRIVNLSTDIELHGADKRGLSK